MKIRIGSRGSRLAVTQARWVGDRLAARHPGLEVEYRQITTTGDRDAQSALTAIGGKGVFVKEIEEALRSRDIDLAIHSLKDVPQTLAAGLRLGPAPLREDPRDAVVSRFGELLRELPRGSTIGTSSPRRAAQIRNRYARRLYRVEPIRGNVDTRLKKVQAGDYDSVVLAAAGLNRLGLSGEITEVLDPEEMMPAPCQGCLGLELREDDASTLELLHLIRDEAADVTSRAERAFLQALGGDCLIPVGAFAQLSGANLTLSAVLLDAGGARAVRAREEGASAEAELVGAKLAGRLLMEGGSEILLGSPPEGAS